MKNVIITGATSFIGIPLILRLLKSTDFNIIALVQSNEKAKSILPNNKRLHIIQIDMGNYRELNSFVNVHCDCLIHLAWNGTRGEDRMNYVLQRKNYEASITLVEEAICLNCKMIICAGSQAEYGIQNTEIVEDTPCNPNTEYGIQKLRFFLDATNLANESNIHLKEARFFSLYGPGDFEGTMIMSTLKKMLCNEDCPLTECTQTWDFLYISDAVEGIVRMISQDCADGPYNVGSGLAHDLKYYIDEMKAITNSTSNLMYGAIPYPKTGIVSINPNINRLKEEIGWVPQICFQEGIARTIRYIRTGVLNY